ncbi:MAG: GNAT family N-acetyltransferase [Lachnospiraceae bacterium]|nr:GNAT family N-acetyltransferase [Lachnospiraceae bacterium]
MIVFRDIILRDFMESDIATRITWETTETEWQLWDAPWEYDDLTDAQREEELQRYIATMRKWVERYRNLPDSEVRSTFQITLNNASRKYIGWCNSYNIDENYESTCGDGWCTIGIDIPEMAARGQGYAYQAWYAFICYLLEHGEENIYTQTWSGNTRMIHVAEKMGFEECHRKVGKRLVRGQVYDGLTFRLNLEKFQKFGQNI